VQVLLSLADGRSPARELSVASADSAEAPGGALEVLQLLPRLAVNALRQGANAIESVTPYALSPARVPSLAQQALGIGGELLKLAALPDDPPTRLKRALTGSRRLAWAQSLSLEEVHTLGTALGCTVNDVLISTLAGALGRYLETHGDAIEGLTLRATVPVNLRPPTAGENPREGIELGNRFGLVFVELPIGIRHPLERLYAVHAAMATLKGSPQALATLGLLALVGSLPPAVEEFALGLFSAKASLVASNLPGPAETLHLAGRPVNEMLFWVPQSGSIGTGVSMLTYRGRVQFGVISDRELIADPRRLVELLAVEFERLVLLVLLGGGALA
jgi:WS/DGAT/MGAT family acyltransferase